MTFLLQPLPAGALTTSPKCRRQGQGWENEGGDQLQEHLRNLKVHKFMGPDEMHPKVLRVLVDELSKTLSVTFGKSWQSEVHTSWNPNF